MAVIYYPKGQLLVRDTGSGSYESIVISAQPNVVLYFGTGSSIDPISASNLPVTASFALTALTSNYLNGFPFDTASIIVDQTGSIVIIQRDTGSLTSAFFNYTIVSGSNMRTGQVFGGWLGNTCSYTDISTTDIGDTSQVTMSIFISQSYLQLLINAQATNNWSVKTTGTYL